MWYSICTVLQISIAYYNSHTQALFRHSDTIAIDKKVCFYRQLFADPFKPRRTNTDPVGHWGALIGWPVVPNCSTWRLLSLWYGQGCCGHLSGPLCAQLGRLCLLASLTHPPSPSLPTPLYVALVISQAVFKTSLKNQSVHPVATYVS